MDLSYESFKKGKLKVNKSKNDLSYSTFLNNKEKQKQINTDKEQRISQGLPVSVKSNRATPTMGGNLVRGAIKPFADVASNILGGADLSNKYLGKVEGLGKIDITKSPLDKENLKTVKRSVLTGLEIGSYATGGGAAVGAGKNVVKQGAKEFLKTSGKQLVKEGAITSGLGSIGYQGREGKINPLQVLRDTAIGAVASPLLGVGVNKLFGKGASKVVDNIPTQKTSKLLPDEEVNKLLPLDKQDYTQHLKSKLDNLPEPKADEQTVIFGGDGKNGQYVDTDIKVALNRGVNENTNVMNVKKSELGLPDADRAERGERILNKQGTQVLDTTPEIKTQSISKDVDKISKDISNVDDYQPGTFEDWSKTIRDLDVNEVKKVAMGGDKITQNNIPKNAYLSVMKNIAEETGDVKLAKELAFSNVSSKGGQELVASKIANTDNVTDTLREIRLSKLKRFNVDEKVFNKNADETVKSIKNQIDNMSSKKSTVEEVKEIIRDLICK